MVEQVSLTNSSQFRIEAPYAVLAYRGTRKMRMSLTFLKRPADGERGPHYAATTGTWPHQRRYILEKLSWEWSFTVLRHVPGKGFVFTSGGNKSLRTLKAAKDYCERLNVPEPILESQRTDG
jgi:hypothetical protein